MNTVSDILRDADPLRHEPDRLAGERARIRHALVTATASPIAPSPARARRPVALLVTLVLIAGTVFAGSQAWWGGTTLHAALRFEVRLAEEQPAAGLFAARVAGADWLVYLHPDTVVTNDDIARSSVVAGNAPSRFGVVVQFTAAGAERMRHATAGHIGKPVAILIDGDVVMALVLRSPISGSAVISGDYTRAEAEEIVNGIEMR